MRSDWRKAAVAAVVMMIAAACGGHGTDTLGGDNDNGGSDPNPSESPGGTGSPALIEFVIPDSDATASDGSTTFQSHIGPIGDGSKPQGSLIRFRILNSKGQPARDGLRVLFSVEGVPDAQLTQIKDHSQNGFVETVLVAGPTAGNAVVVAQVFETNLIARSATVSIGKAAGPAVALEFFGLRLPGLLGNADDQEGTPETRTQLGIKGSGAQAVDVVFAVLGAEGGPALDGAVIDFSLFGPNGGEFISPTSVQSAGGFVRATVNTGTRPGPVEVTARVRGTTILARAIPITIGGSLNPVGTHMSIAAQCLNVAGSVTFGLRDDIRIGLSDANGNEIPIGSAVSFFTEGGGIFAQGISEDGLEAHADLVTQLPIPPDRRVNVMGVTTGQEAFTDLNGNNRFDPGEPFIDMPPEVFLDANEDGVYELGEFFLDQNNNGVYDGTPNNQWDEQALIAAQMPIVFSGHTQIRLDPTTFELGPNETIPIELLLTDEIGSALTGITKVTITADGAKVSPTEFGIPDTNVNTLVEPIDGLTRFTLVVSNPVQAGSGAELVPTLATVTITVKSDVLAGDDLGCPGGNGSVTTTIIGTVLKPVTQPSPTPATSPAP